MIAWFQSGGFFMWPILVAGLVSLVLAADAGRKLASGTAAGPALRTRIDSVLFWGGFAALLGLFGTVGGIGQTARAIERAGDVSASLAWSGIRVSLITTAFGLIVLAVAMLAWLALRTARHRAAER